MKLLFRVTCMHGVFTRAGILMRLCHFWLLACRYIASDCDAVAIMRDAQRYAQSPEDAVALALKAGKHA